ncbi:tRNA wybutosine-synthesizing protein 2 homolog [Stegodyphus dumicola]|uniref:tRNA wybutosine-synthesizing protein 2 homolog n=1 Tax=Stegodyphus dumicola TaxID=202533 RepID=UPI0015AEB2B6|nr:tRNA wybutosine-synthesizing protein 2 homolog [Stegodyphus dumicola]
MLHSKREKKWESPKEALSKLLANLFADTGIDMPNDVPSKWEKHGDLILLPSSSFQHPIWANFGNSLWDVVSAALKCNKIARKYKVQNNDFRSPQVDLLKGSDGWVTHVDNKIKYTYDVTKCMFSAGNISEKLRISNFSCEGETIVDLYAGIGYFTLPFLIHAKAAVVHACEWNPYAVEALEKNLIINGVQKKCVIHFGDNREVCPEKVADRINLGLIPSSERGWPTAARALKPSGGILHVHGNVTSNLGNTLQPIKSPKEGNFLKPEWVKWSESVCSTFQNIFLDIYETDWNVKVLNITRIKSYAPHIDHLVADIKCTPQNVK